MAEERIARIESATLIGRRPRPAGNNARLGGHGLEVTVPLIRLTTTEGASGFGVSQLERDGAQSFLGRNISELLTADERVNESARDIDFPLWDLLGQLKGQPVYKLVATDDISQPLRVPCYDTSLYMNGLHLDSDDAAADLIAGYASEGWEQNHRAFKIKVGRGALHMPLEAGIRRDIAVIKAVRAAVGPDARIMIDANNGYNFNIARRVLEETADCDVFWLEEAFHEDPELYKALRRWLDAQGLGTLIADGEGWAAAMLMDWARAGWVDVLQYDIFSHSFSAWLQTGAELDAWQLKTAPHHYGRHLGNYVSGHLAAAVQGFAFVEWDETDTPGIEASAYRVEAGQVGVPDLPGFGLGLEEDVFRKAVAEGGWELGL